MRRMRFWRAIDGLAISMENPSSRGFHSINLQLSGRL
jgi:hypothetical protein